jgi:hypothetical protein
MLVSIVQAVDERAHNLRIADAVVLAQLLEGTATALRIATSLRFINPVSNFAGICIAALGVAALGSRCTGSRARRRMWGARRWGLRRGGVSRSGW